MGAKGQPKEPLSGRKKGSLNKSTREVEEIAKRLGIIPFEVLCRFTANDWEGLGYDSPLIQIGTTDKGEPIVKERISAEARINAAKECCKYLHTQLRAVDHSGQIDNPYAEKPLEELKKLIKATIK